MFGTYKSGDVTLLLKDISGYITPLDTQTREKLIQTGTHYSEMLPLEYVPSPEYMEIFHQLLDENAKSTALTVGSVAEQIWRNKNRNAVIVSLARAGTPIGILIKRYILNKFDADTPHYSISIIRDKGIDDNAINYILERHKSRDIQFVDGWTGKGAINGQLAQAVKVYEGLSPSLAVLADPAYICETCGTHDDVIIPSCCLNSTISGLLSRTFLRDDLISHDDFHGAAFYSHLISDDLTYYFINKIEKEFEYNYKYPEFKNTCTYAGVNEIMEIAEVFKIKDLKLVKPGIGETTRVLLRRVPEFILIDKSRDGWDLKHIYRLAKEKNVKIIDYPLKNYKACGVITDLSKQ